MYNEVIKRIIDMDVEDEFCFIVQEKANKDVRISYKGKVY